MVGVAIRDSRSTMSWSNNLSQPPRNGSGYTRTDDGKSQVGDGFPVDLIKHVGYEIIKTSMDLPQRICQTKSSSEW